MYQFYESFISILFGATIFLVGISENCTIEVPILGGLLFAIGVFCAVASRK